MEKKALRNYDFSLTGLQSAMEGLEPEHCIKPHENWSRFKDNGNKLLAGLDSQLNISTSGNYLDVFSPIVQAYEEWFYEGFPKKNHPNYEHIAPIMILLYDMLLSLRRSYIHRSATNSGIITRTIFEAMVNLADISKNPNKNAQQFTKYKKVAVLWYEYQCEKIDQETLKKKMKEFPEWYDEDWKTMKNKRDSWTGVRGDTVYNMAVRNDLLEAYQSLYRTTSAFIHVSPLISNYYIGQGYGPLCRESGVFQISYIGLNFVIDSLVSACAIVDFDGSQLESDLKLPFAIISRADGMS